MICKKKIREIRTPFLIDCFRCKILAELIAKYFMWLSLLILRFFRTHNRAEFQFLIHIFVNRCATVSISLTLQINLHIPVTIYTIVRMVNFFNQGMHLRFMCIVIRLPVFLVVVVCVWIDIKSLEKPTQTK